MVCAEALINAVFGNLHTMALAWNLMDGVAPLERRSFSLGRRLQALWTVVGLITLMGASGPHFIHHLPDLYLSQDHQDHADHRDHHDHPDPSPQTNCVILFLLQHTPLQQGSGHLPVLPLWSGDQVAIEPESDLPGSLNSVSQARAPPPRCLFISY